MKDCVCDKVVCERLCVKDCVCVCDKVVCERLRVRKLCVCEMLSATKFYKVLCERVVCDKVVCV